MINNKIYKDVDVNDMILGRNVSVSRNFKDYLFVDKMSVDEARALVDTIFCVIASKNINEEFTVIKLWECSEDALKVYFDKNILNEKLLKRKEKAAIIINEDETLIIIINEEDHLKIKYSKKGLSIREQFEYINIIDNSIEEDMTYSFSETLGYLTSSVSNVGTGLRASVNIHLPVMSLGEEIQNITNGLNKVGMNIEGIYKEGTRAIGSIYTISNQITLGVREVEIINNLEGIVENIAHEENKFREVFSEKYKYELEDRIFRSYGILKNAKLLRDKEVLNLLSYVRLGAEIGLLDLDKDKLDYLLIETRNSVLQSKYENQLDNIGLDLYRAEVCKAII